MNIQNKYNFNVDDLPEEYFENPMNMYIKEFQKNFDKSIIQFLQENGYEVPNPPTATYFHNLCNELKLQDKFIDTIEWIDNDYTNLNFTQHIIPFFNSISNPITEEAKQWLIEEYRRKNEST